MNPKFSIIIPVYNVERYLRTCLDSILTQSFKDWEILLVDDGSPDGSPAICDEYAQKDVRIRVFHKENGGVSSARNLGLENARGEWVWYVDPDDWIEIDALKVLSKYIESYNPDTVIFGMRFTDEKGNDLGNDVKKHKEGAVDSVFECFDYGPPSVLQKRDILEKNNLRFTQGIRLGEDLELQYKFLMMCYKAVQIEEVLYIVLRRDGSATNNPKTFQNAAEDLPKVLRSIISFIQNNKIEEKPWIAKRINRIFKSAMNMNYLAKTQDVSYLQRTINDADQILRHIGFTKYKDSAVYIGCLDVRLYFLFQKMRKFFNLK